MLQKYLKMVVLTMARINYRSKVSKILHKLIKFVRNNKHILDRFFYKNFKQLTIIFNFCDMAYADFIYNKNFCLLIIFLATDDFKSDFYYIVIK